MTDTPFIFTGVDWAESEKLDSEYIKSLEKNTMTHDEFMNLYLGKWEPEDPIIRKRDCEDKRYFK